MMEKKEEGGWLESKHIGTAVQLLEALPGSASGWLILFACYRTVAAHLITSWCGTVRVVWHQRPLHIHLAGILQPYFFVA
jgi:hypothetical protein